MSIVHKNVKFRVRNLNMQCACRPDMHSKYAIVVRIGLPSLVAEP
jgi:hypothetical protein